VEISATVKVSATVSASSDTTLMLTEVVVAVVLEVTLRLRLIGGGGESVSKDVSKGLISVTEVGVLKKEGCGDWGRLPPKRKWRKAGELGELRDDGEDDPGDRHVGVWARATQEKFWN